MRRVLAIGLAALCVLVAAAVGTGAVSTASLTLSPNVGPPTSAVAVHGVGFGAGETVALTFDAASVGSVTADDSGSFDANFTVPGTAQPGVHQVSAVGQTGGKSAQQPFRVRTDWRQFRRIETHTGLNPFENTLATGNVNQLQRLWTRATPFEIVGSSPAVVAGRVFLGNLDDQNTGSLYALDAATGAVRWSTPTGGYVLSSPGVRDGVVYGGSDDGKLYALDAATGAVLWAKQTGNAVQSSPVVVAGTLYFTSQDGNLYALDTATGATRWTAAVGPSTVDSPAVADGRVFVGSDTGAVFAFDAASGALLWTKAAGDRSIVSSPIVTGGRVIVRSVNAHLYAFKASTGQRLWNVTLPGSDDSTPAAADGLVYVSVRTGDTSTHELLAIDPLNGSTTWTKSLDTIASLGTFDSSPAIANGVVYIGSADADGHIYGLDAVSGATLWQAATGSPVESSPAIADGRLYVASLNGKVYAYGLKST